jgi:hypothetical protein
VLPPEVPQVFLADQGSQAGLAYRPGLLGLARVHFSDGKLGVDEIRNLALLAPLDGVAVDWQTGSELQVEELQREPAPGALLARCPASPVKPRATGRGRSRLPTRWGGGRNSNC